MKDEILVTIKGIPFKGFKEKIETFIEMHKKRC